jgi:hypothetical protein
MSVDRVDAFPAPSVERTGGVSRLARWFRPQAFRERALRREQEADDALRIGDINWQWRQACALSGLGRLVYTPSGPSVAIPLIGRVTPGPPTRFTVRRRPGQLLADFEAAAPRISAAMGVAGIRVRPLVGEWIMIELIHTQPTLRSLGPAPTTPFPARSVEPVSSAA